MGNRERQPCRAARVGARAAGPHATYLPLVFFVSTLLAVLAPRQAQAAGELTVSSNTLQFGNVTVGDSHTIKVLLKNSGNSSLVLSGHSVSGSGFSTSGISYPMTLHAGAKLVLDVRFLPTKTGNASGSVQLYTKGANGTISIILKGAGVANHAVGYLSATPLSAQFQNVAVGTENTQSIQLRNTGSANLTISSVKATGDGFSVSGLTTPLSILAGGSAQFTIGFLPLSVGSSSGSVVLTSSASDSQLSVVLSGTGVGSSRVLNVSPASLAFGNVNVSGSAIRQITLKNAGNSNITIAAQSVTGAGLSVADLPAGTTLVPEQTAVLAVEFAPTVLGSVIGAITIKSNASNAPSYVIPVTGTGIVAANSVSLQWLPSTSADVLGYYVYRSTVSGGPYTNLLSSPVAGTSYIDLNVHTGTAYYYVVTAVTASGTQSAFSSQVEVTVP